MAAQLVPRSQWEEFGQWLSRRCRRWRVTAHWHTGWAQTRLLVQNAPLESVRVALSQRLAFSSITERTFGAALPPDTQETDRVWIEFSTDLRALPRLEFMGVVQIRYFAADGREGLELESPGASVLSLQLQPPVS